MSSTILSKQLSISEDTTVTLDGSHTTVLRSARLIPVPAENRLSLNGNWKIRPQAVSPDGFEHWETVSQPGKVCYADVEGGKIDQPDWDRVSCRHLSEDLFVMMVRTVEIPESWNGKRIFLRFNSIYPGGDVFVNGRLVGIQRSGLTPIAFDVTDMLLDSNPQVIAVRLIRNHPFLKMDMARHALEFAGLAQDAFLFAVPENHVNDYHFRTILDDSFTRGTFTGEVSLNLPDSGCPLSLTLSRRGQTVCSDTQIPAAGQSVCSFSLDIPHPVLWSDEFPELYDVELRYGDTQYTWRTGFRRLELSPDGTRLNGSFVKFRGVNHLTFHPQFGLYTPKDWLRQNLLLMKKANINAIRTHYAGPEALQELCDELGFYLIQEIPIDWGTNYIHDSAWVGPALHRIESIIRRDRHHCSVMIWSVGNENMPESAAVAPAGWAHLRLYEQFCHMLDDRPTMFPPPGPANKIEGILELRFGEVADIHYNLEPVRSFLKNGSIALPNSWEGDHITVTREEALKRGWSGCWFSSEWGLFNLIPDLLHNAPGSLIGSVTEDPYAGKTTMQAFIERLQRDWGFMRSEKSCLGGAYFPWMSAAASDTPEENPWGWMRYSEDADWGVVCADLTVKPEFWALRKAFSPVSFPDRLIWRKGQQDINFQIENQFNSINLKDCTLRVQFKAVGKWMTMMRNFIDCSVDCPPGQSAIMEIPVTDTMRASLDKGQAFLMRITFLKPDGFKVTVHETFILPENLMRSGDQLMPIGPDAVL